MKRFKQAQQSLNISEVNSYPLQQQQSWVAVGAAAVTAVGSVVSAQQGKSKGGAAVAPAPIDISKASGDAISANRANFSGSAALAAQTNSFNAGQAKSLLEQAIPGYGAIQSKLLDSINSDLDSQNSMPKDMQDQISQFAAEKGITRGTSGNFNDFSLVKDFGFNLTDWKNASRARALNTLSTVFNQAPRVNPLSPSAMFVDPNQSIAAQSSNSAAAYQSQQAAANSSAAASNYNNSLWAGAIQGVTKAGAGAIANSGSSSNDAGIVTFQGGGKSLPAMPGDR